MNESPATTSEDSVGICSGTLNTNTKVLDWGNDDEDDDAVTRWALFADYNSRIPFTVKKRPYCDFSEHLHDGLYLDLEQFIVTGGREWI